ncbi:alpha/beta hydrolase [Aliikangiella sp. IMCC44359]|uniref:alpha/beta hydrolase n=1 Tax=Aliikangiella sp. IMCC44359 TaxID=3459125 RepID=UPI00403AFEC1
MKKDEHTQMIMQYKKIKKALSVIKRSSIFTIASLSIAHTTAFANVIPEQLNRLNSYSVPKIQWQTCEGIPAPFECATIEVPLDYSQLASLPSPEKLTTTTLALARYPASDPDNKIGSIFLNPGGPGGSGVDLILNAGPYLFDQETRAHFDLIGFDPRGIAASSPLTCFQTTDEQQKALGGPDNPTAFRDIIARKKADKFYAKTCKKNGGQILNNMSTADVARDLDLLRQAVGDDKINFVGYSYGSYLGMTYANMFPNNIRSLIIDGVLDPIAWSTGRNYESFYTPITTRLKSDIGTMDTLNEFFRLCDSQSDTCTFAGNASQRYDAIYQHLKIEPLEIPIDENQTFLLTSDVLLNITASSMYNSASWSNLAQFLLNIELAQTPQKIASDLANLYDSLNFTKELRFTEKLPQSSEGFTSVLCSDSENPRDYFFWPLAAQISNDKNGYFGAYWTWASSPCKFWKSPAKNRFTGPFDHQTNHPILVASTRFDPATPYHGAEISAELMPNSRLLTVEAWGHTTPFLSACADSIVSNYLLTGELPEAKNTICQPNSVPFETTNVQSSLSPAKGEKSAEEKRKILLRQLTQAPIR